MSKEEYEQTGAAFDERFSEVNERIDALGEHAGDGVIDYQQLAAALEPYLNTGGRSDEEIRQLIAAYVDENVETGGGGMTQAEVEEIVTASLADLDIQGFDEEVIERVRHHAEALDFPARRVGPSKPIGEMHAVPMWGVKFATGRSCHIHSAVVDAGEAGTFTAVLGETDGVEQFDTVDSTEAEVKEGIQRVALDLEVPEAGYYLLAREGDFPLRRGQWNGWDEHAVDNLRLAAGDKPGFEENDYYYYFFDCEMTASKDHEFPK